jgi:ribosomal-protein-alanine N-acetyltransferase
VIFPEIVQTTRLLLRRPQPEDAKVIFDEYAQDPAVTRYLIWSPHSSVETTQAFIASSSAHLEQGTAYPYIIANAASAELLGMIEIRPHGHRADFGYVLARRHWCQGFGSEAIAAIVRIAISSPDIFRVEATCDVENVASARALEKAGLTREGLLRRYIIHPAISSEPRDSYIYAIVR